MNIVKTNFNYRGRLIPLNLDKVLFITIHHTASETATPEEIHRWHLNNGWHGFGYNEYIRKDGTEYIGRGDHIGAHTANMNSKTYGICAEGNYDVQEKMPKAQLEAMIERVKVNIPRFKNFEGIERHSEFYNKSCPGRHFPFEKLVAKIEKPKDKLAEAVNVLNKKGIINSPDYWIENAREDKTVNGEFAALLIKRVADLLMRGDDLR